MVELVLKSVQPEEQAKRKKSAETKTKEEKKLKYEMRASIKRKSKQIQLMD